jgi:UDP-N-acetylglucosamine 2-epimerase
MSDIFFRELGMPEDINRKLTDAISDLLFVKGGHAAERIADIQLRQ